MKKHYLVVADDSDDVRQAVAKHFEGNAEIVVAAEARNGVEAVELVKQIEPDILLLDIVMPELDGYGVLNQLSKLTNKPYTICFSQLNSDLCINKALTSGADYYMLKPLNPKALEEHILEAVASGDRRSNPSVHKYMQRGGNSVDEKIANIFISVGIPAHIKGYHFLREAIKLAVETPDIINSITKRLYPSIANKFNTSASKVERAIRHAIEVAWNRGKIENINNLFGMKVYGSNDKPTNGEFIALIADKLLIEGV